MIKPRRGEIWYVNLSDPATGREARGSEIGAKPDEQGEQQPERPCLIVSADDFNENRDGLTIVPLTHYEDRKNNTMPWAEIIRPWTDVDIDSANTKNPKKLKTDKPSIIDCAQLWTVFATDKPSLPNDLRWRCGKLKDLSGVNAYLQDILVSGGVRRIPEGLRFQEGDVLSLDLPGRSGQQCLVVSSVAVDRRREKIWVERLKRGLGHITVVPLELRDDYDEKDHGIAPVEIHASGTQPRSDIALAICQEIYTVDWRARNAPRKPIGQVHYMSDVRTALRHSLDLPQ